jgi:adenylate cyclase class 2
MNTEIEATFIGTEHNILREKLEKLGAVITKKECLIKRTIFDYEDLRLDKMAAWVRLRDEGDGITLTFKQRKSETIDGMKEIEIVVSDFEQTKALLLAIGLVIKAEQETKREVWELNGTEVMLDTWPWLKPITEIEGESKEVVKELSDKLGFKWEEAVFDSTDGLYQLEFDVTRTEISTCPIKFGEVPLWLEERRRNK